MTNEKDKAIKGLIIISITLISGLIAAYISNVYYIHTQLQSIIPAIGMIVFQLLILRIAELPKERGRKDDLFIILMTLIAWFISYTLIIQI